MLLTQKNQFTTRFLTSILCKNEKTNVISNVAKRNEKSGFQNKQSLKQIPLPKLRDLNDTNLQIDGFPTLCSLEMTFFLILKKSDKTECCFHLRTDLLFNDSTE